MMYQVEINPLEQLSTNKVSTKLPKKIIEAYSSLPLFPEACPAWKVKVNPVHIRKGHASQGAVNHVAVILPGNDPYFVEPRDLVNPLPTDTRL